jgi:hypothetical protein
VTEHPTDYEDVECHLGHHYTRVDGKMPVCAGECECHMCPSCHWIMLDRTEVDAGWGIIHGPWGCFSCGWSSDPRYDCRETWPAGKPDGAGRLDPIGGWRRDLSLPQGDARVTSRFPEVQDE